MSFVEYALVGSLASLGATASKGFAPPTSNVANFGRVNGLAILSAYAAGRLWQPEGKMSTWLSSCVVGGLTGSTHCALRTKDEQVGIKDVAAGALVGACAAAFVDRFVVPS